MKIAAISDIHGNLIALEAVLADIEASGADVVVNLGDTVSGALQPGETAQRLISLGLPTIKGNHERQLLFVDSLRIGTVGQPGTQNVASSSATVACGPAGDAVAAERHLAGSWHTAQRYGVHAGDSHRARVSSSNEERDN